MHRLDVLVGRVAPHAAEDVGSSIGLPHSSHSVTVSGSDSVEDRVEGVDEGHLGDDRPKRSGARLATAPMSSPPGAAAAGDQAVRRRAALGDEVLGRRRRSR